MYGHRNNIVTDSRAFTLAEMMLTLGLMGILMSVATVAASDMLRNARQATLDNTARTLYMNAQMSLTAAKLSGKEINLRELQAENPFLSVQSAHTKLKLVEAEDAWKTELSDAPDFRLWKNDPKLYEDGENRTKALRDILFSSLSDGRGNAELSGGYWAIAVDPCSFSVVGAYFSRDDGGDGAAYFQSLYDDANREERLSELTLVENRLKDGALIGYYGPESVGFAADMPFERIANGGPSPKNPSDCIDSAVTRKTPVNSTESASNLVHKMYCWIGYDENQDAPIFNGETLVTRLNCWIPADSAFEIDNRPADVDFTLTVTGASSGKVRTFRYRMARYGTETLCRNLDANEEASILGAVCRMEEREAMDADGMPVTVSGWRYSYPVILDSPLDDGEGVLLHGNRPFQARFPDFIPGEDIILQFETDVCENGEAVIKNAKRAALDALSDGEKNAYGLDRISEQAVIDDDSGAYDWLWKSHWPGWDERPSCNSLFADMDGQSDGVGAFVGEAKAESEPEEPQSASEEPEPEETQTVPEEPEPEEPQTVSEEPEPTEAQTVSGELEPEETQAAPEESEPEETQAVPEEPEPEETQAVSEEPEPEEPQPVSEEPEPTEPQVVSEEAEPEEPQSVSEEPEPEEAQTVPEEPEETQTISEEPEPEEPQPVSEEPEPEEPQPVSEKPEREEPQPVSEEPESEEVEMIVNLAFGDAIADMEAYRDLGFWDAPEALRDALTAAQFASAWGEAGRAALKIKGAAGTTLRQNLNGLDFAGFALDEENSTLDKELIRQSPEELQDGGGFTLSYLRAQDEEAWSEELWTE